MQFGIRVAALGLLLSLGLAGCGGNGDGNPVNPPGGSLELNSGDIPANGGQFSHQFRTAGTFPYHCAHHSMSGSVTVQMGAAATASVNIPGSSFQPGTITVGVDGVVTWTNSDNVAHTVTSN